MGSKHFVAPPTGWQVRRLYGPETPNERPGCCEVLEKAMPSWKLAGIRLERISLAEALQGSRRGEEALILLDSAIAFFAEAGAATEHETAQQLATRIADPS